MIYYNGYMNTIGNLKMIMEEHIIPKGIEVIKILYLLLIIIKIIIGKNIYLKITIQIYLCQAITILIQI